MLGDGIHLVDCFATYGIADFLLFCSILIPLCLTLHCGCLTIN